MLSAYQGSSRFWVKTSAGRVEEDWALPGPNLTYACGARSLGEGGIAGSAPRSAQQHAREGWVRRTKGGPDGRPAPRGPWRLAAALVDRRGVGCGAWDGVMQITPGHEPAHEHFGTGTALVVLAGRINQGRAEGTGGRACAPRLLEAKPGTFPCRSDELPTRLSRGAGCVTPSGAGPLARAASRGSTRAGPDHRETLSAQARRQSSKRSAAISTENAREAEEADGIWRPLPERKT